MGNVPIWARTARGKGGMKMNKIKQMLFGICTHCREKPATRMPLKHCQACADELFTLPPGSQERRDWFEKGVI